jgi:hypothetical protein
MLFNISIMKASIILVLLLLCVAGYAYSTNPAGCAKLGTDFVAVFLPPPAAPASPAPASVIKPAVPGSQPAPTSMPTPSSSPASTAPSSSTPVPTPAPVKAWSPPDVMPAQANWTWVASDGKTYQNVVVTKIEPETVSISHSMGVAHIAISTLPADIQKQLNYDPAAAAAAKVESDREAAHPFYRLAAMADAKKAAHQLHWPLAWICSDIATLNTANPVADSEDDLTQMAVNHLKSQTIVIFLDSNADLGAAPANVREEQFFQMDDGVVPGGHHFYAPKIAFSDAEATKTLGRVSHTQMMATREGAIDTALESIAKDADAQALLNAPPPSAPAPTSTSAAAK